MTKLPKLFPDHQHQWAAVHEPDIDASYLNPDFTPPPLATQVRCTVCGFQVPRSLAQLDGTPALKEPT